MTRWALLVLVAVGCAPAAEGDTEPRYVFTPDAVLEGETVKWAARWAAATGLDITVGPGGTRVIDDDSWSDDSGQCGAEIATYRGSRLVHDEIHIDRTSPPGCSGWGYVLGHEFGHGLGAEHAASGMMQQRLPVGHVYRISAESLEQVCSRAPCRTFAPEE